MHVCENALCYDVILCIYGYGARAGRDTVPMAEQSKCPSLCVVDEEWDWSLWSTEGIKVST